MTCSIKRWFISRSSHSLGLSLLGVERPKRRGFSTAKISMIPAKAGSRPDETSTVAALVWFRNDLRIADHEPLHAALSSNPAVLLPLYCLDHRQMLPRHIPTYPLHETAALSTAPAEGTHVLPIIDVQPTPAQSLEGLGIPQLGPYRLRALLEALSSLHASLQSLGSGLAFHQGLPEEVLKAAASTLCTLASAREDPPSAPQQAQQQEEALGGSGPRSRDELGKSRPREEGASWGGVGSIELYYYMEVEGEGVEAAVDEAVRAAAAKHGVACSVRRYWGATLYHPDDLPYHLYETGEGAQHAQRAQNGAAHTQQEPQAGAAGEGGREAGSSSGLGRDAVDPLRFQIFPGVMTNFRKILQAHSEVRLPLPSPVCLPPLPHTDASTCQPLLGQGLPHSVQDVYAAAGPAAVAAVRRLEALVGRDILDSLPLPGTGPPDPRSALPFIVDEGQAVQRLQYYLGLAPLAGGQGGQGDQGPPIRGYQDSRMMAHGVDTSAKLSAFLSLGCLSPRTVFWEAQRALEAEEAGGDAPPSGDTGAGGQEGQLARQAQHARQGWREPVRGDGARWLQMHLGIRDFFIYTALKEGPGRLLQLGGGKGDSAPGGSWRGDVADLERWARGQTGLPFVDACMRELGGTGFMSNRGRQNVVSFLAKALQIDWRLGALLFESLLIDHDFAVNTLNWAYNAGTGNDPRNRQFKTVSQGEQYDPEAVLIQAWVPELANLPAELAHRPWEAQTEAAEKQEGGADVAGGQGSAEAVSASSPQATGTYPAPMVDPAGQIRRERGGKAKQYADGNKRGAGRKTSMG